MTVAAGTDIEWDIDLDATVPCQMRPDPCANATTVDLDAPLHCDDRREVGDTCPNTATWRAQRHCCNVARLFCEECRQRAIARDKTIQFTVDHLGGTRACAACNHRPAPDLRWIRL